MDLVTYVPYVTCIRDIWFDRVCISVTWLCCSFAPATEGGRSWLGWPDWNSKLPCALPRDSKRRTCFFSTVFEQVQGCQVHDYCFSYFGMCSNLFHAVHLQPISLIFSTFESSIPILLSWALVSVLQWDQRIWGLPIYFRICLGEGTIGYSKDVQNESKW